MAETNNVTEEELKFATDVAYLDLADLMFTKRETVPGSQIAGQTNHPTIGELLRIDPDGRKCYNQSYFDQLSKEKLSLSADKINQLPDEALDWRIIETFDRNNKGQSGFYGVVIETDKGVIVSFRGSESPSEFQNIEQDWINADLALIKGRLTDQQKDAQRFLDQLKAEGFFDKYDHIKFAGHSLGGNIAEHATFYAAKIGVIDRIDRTISYDGPGHSKDYLVQHKEDIALATSTVQMDHVLQSLVGGLLQPADGVNYFYAELTGKGAVQHGTENVHMDEHGNIVRSDGPSEVSTALSKYLTSPFSQGMDRLLSPGAASVLVTTLAAVAEGGWKIKNAFVKNGKLTTAGKITVTALAAGLTAAVLMAPAAVLGATIALANFAVTLAGFAVVFIASVLVYEFLSDIGDQLAEFIGDVITEFVPQIIETVAESVSKFMKWSAGQLADFRDMLVEGYKKLVGDLRNLFGSGPKAVATPHIKLDTYKLRYYADRLESIKSRISSIDSRLNALYFSEGLLDIIHLAIAERLPTKRQMNRVIDYLNGTADDFEAVENQIMSM